MKVFSVMQAQNPGSNHTNPVNYREGLLRKTGSWFLSPFRHGLRRMMEGPPAHRFLPKLPRQLPDNGRQQALRKKKKKERITLNNLQLVFLIQPSRWVRKGKAGDRGSADKHRTHKYPSTTGHSSGLLKQQ